MTEKTPPYRTAQLDNVVPLFNAPGPNGCFRILISHTSKWDRGYLKIIDCGYLTDAHEVRGYYQKFSDHTSVHTPKDRLDTNCLFREKCLDMMSVQPILEKIDSTEVSLGGPNCQAQFLASFYCLSVTQNNHSVMVAWNSHPTDFDYPFEEIWKMVDDLIAF